MEKKKNAKTGKKSKAPLRSTAAEHKVQATQKDSADQMAEEVKVEAPKVVEEQAGALQRRLRRRRLRKHPRRNRPTRPPEGASCSSARNAIPSSRPAAWAM